MPVKALPCLFQSTDVQWHLCSVLNVYEYMCLLVCLCVLGINALLVPGPRLTGLEQPGSSGLGGTNPLHPKLTYLVSL